MDERTRRRLERGIAAGVVQEHLPDFVAVCAAPDGCFVRLVDAPDWLNAAVLLREVRQVHAPARVFVAWNTWSAEYRVASSQGQRTWIGSGDTEVGALLDALGVPDE